MSNQYGPRIVTDGLILCLDAANSKSYPGSGTVWNDLSGNGNNGTLINGPVYNSSNKGNVVLDGINDYIDITENANMKPQLLTIDYTLKINSTVNTTYGGSPANLQYLLFRQNSRVGGYEGYVLYYVEDSKSFSIGATPVGGTPQYAINSSGYKSIEIGTINTLTAVFNNTSMSIYTNGIFQVSGVKASGIDYNATHTLKLGRPIAVGSTFGSASNMSIYSLKIYNRILTDTEILQNFNAIKGKYGV